VLPTAGILLEGTAVIISPLIALMKNQVDAIRGYSSKDNMLTSQLISYQSTAEAGEERI
jgi:superfamily II DNA helicase RecQ